MRSKRHLFVGAVLVASAAAGCRGGKQAGPAAQPDAMGTPPVAAQPQAPKKPDADNIRAVYLTGWSAGGKKKMQNIVALIKKAGLNAVVIDVKDSDGAISFPMDIPWAKQVEAKRGKIKEINHYSYAQRTRNIDSVMKLLKENNIYAIARIAVFADDILPRVRPDLAVQKPSGGIWENRKRESWVNPYSREVWDYQAAIAIEAAKKGFSEIQWDYVRFPTDGKLLSMRFPGKTADPQHEVIAKFLGYTRKKLEPYGVVMAADIFGLTGLVKNGMGIGQVIQKVAENVDYICPMVYPSHYHKGEYGIANPNSEPYQIIFVSLRDAKKRLEGTGCKIRPWLQNFSLPDRGRFGGSHYGPAQIAAQIRATRDNGIEGFMMWDPNNRFNGLSDAMAVISKEKPKKAAAAPAPAAQPKKP